MKTRNRVIVIISVAIMLASIFAFTGGAQTKPELTLKLQSPSFVLAATDGKVESAPSEVTAKLSEEAGISAYKKTADPISLSQVRGLFRTIEMETADYIIGSVPVPNYIEHFDVHVYVHTDGWILAYYLEDQVTSKIIDVRAETILTTLLETTISTVAGAVGETSTGLKYYDFRYPNATNILMVAEDEINGDDFTIKLPSEYVYYERSYSIRFYVGYTTGHFNINGTSQPLSFEGNNVKYGPILATTLLPGETHTIDLFHAYYGVLTITYRVP